MARPLWLRLFGPNGPTTISELRDALKNVTFGQGLGDGHVAARLFELTGLTPASVERPGPMEADRNVIVPASAGPDGASRRPLDNRSSGPGPIPAAAPDDSRVFTLQVGLTPFAYNEIPKLIDNSQEEAKGPVQGFVGGWLETYLRFQLPQGGPQIEFHDPAPGEMATAFGRFDARLDTLALSGDFSAGFTLSALPANIVALVLGEGHDYVLIADDDFVAGGRSLAIHGDRLGGNHILFDGSAETDGRFSFFGSDADDIVFGGAGNDVLRGMGGADMLTGGGGSDVFGYVAASDSAGANYDILADFNPSADKIDLPGTVSGFSAAVLGGSLSDSSLAQDLGAALSSLGAGKAIVYAPNAGDLAHTIFLVVDGNGIAGYQDGEDYVFALPGATLADLAAHTDIFV